MRTLVLIFLLTATLPVFAQGSPEARVAEQPALASPTLARSSLEAFRLHLSPEDEEASWSNIPWIPSFAGGFNEAAQKRRPLLLWVMNGHPLGST